MNPARKSALTAIREVKWITVDERTRTKALLEDRAAKYLPDENLLQINGDFRVFTDMIERWCDQYSHVSGGRGTVTQVVREWYEQALRSSARKR